MWRELFFARVLFVEMDEGRNVQKKCGYKGRIVVFELRRRQYTTRDELLAGILDVTASIQKREDELSKQ
jgi:hypothetical protein